MGVTKTQVVKFIRKGDKGDAGENGITISLLPAALTPKVGVSSTLRAQVALYDGGRLIGYNDETDGNMLCSTLPTSSAYNWTFRVESGKFYFVIMLTPTDTTAISLPFTITYKGAKYDSVITIQPVADGAQGKQGATLRGPQAWSDCANGYSFQAGGDGDSWKDVVIYKDNYYSCIKSHTKTADNYPGSTAANNNKYWQLGDKVELVASKILLATYALVKNLGVEVIDMKDANGNVMFQAKDGNVVCKTGTFENVTVKGKLDGVSGSFKSLNCINGAGKIVGQISFDESGRLWFDGDMYHQGYSEEKNRSLRFFTSDLWCRGQFGSRERNILVINGSYGYYHTKGPTEAGIYVALTSKTDSSKNTYYVVPMYGNNGDYAGFPVDTLIFNISSSTTYRYELSMAESQRALVINANDDRNNVLIYTNGNTTSWNGGEVAEVIKIPSKISPAVNNDVLGRGLLVGAFRDNDW